MATTSRPYSSFEPSRRPSPGYAQPDSRPGSQYDAAGPGAGGQPRPQRQPRQQASRQTLQAPSQGYPPPPPGDGYDNTPSRSRQSFAPGPPPPQQQYYEQQQYAPQGYYPDERDQMGPEDDFYGPGPGEGYGPAAGLPPPPPRSSVSQARNESPTNSGAILDNSHLRPGNQASLLSHERTLELYRANAKKTQDPDLQFEFAVFMMDASKTLPVPTPTNANVMEVEKAMEKREDLVRESTQLLKRLADRGHPASQYFLADCFANGLGTPKGRQDFDRAYPLFVLAAKHGHPDAAYRAGTCCENGWGCRREQAKALQFFRKAAAASHPGAMYRLGIAELNGELGLSRHPKDGVQWLKRSAEHATAEFPHALHELALLHERGIEHVVFVDFEYAAELLAQAAELGYAPSAYKLGECYEYGKMGCPQDAALSIHYYNIAAQQNHRDACFALTAWYLVGSPGVLPQSDTEAFLWAKKAAEGGLAKAMYAVGYFMEVGIGAPIQHNESLLWYKRAADLGDRRAQQRLKGQPARPPGAPGSIATRESEGESGSAVKNGKDKDCVIM